jgi:hypothetical protein
LGASADAPISGLPSVPISTIYLPLSRAALSLMASS